MKISTKELRKVYRDADKDLCIIENLSFDFPEQGTIAIIGRSGIGKSTLLHILGGLDTPTGGHVFYDGLDIAGLNSDDLSAFRGKTVGFIFQFHYLLPEFSALENIAMPLVIGGVSEREATDRARQMLDRVGLEHRSSHLPSQLSGGEQQRVAIGRALVARPAVLLADEPTGSLDVRTAAEVRDLLFEVQREAGSTMITVTHNLELARDMDVQLEMAPGGALTPFIMDLEKRHL